MDEDPYRDEQLVELYDSDNAGREYHEYYRALAEAVQANKIVDFGCGTGLLTRSLAHPGREVIGVDPSATMLGYARRRPGAEAVVWIDGDADAIAGTGDADLVLSSGNTMMHLSPEVYPSVLGSLAAALTSGGVISFESRNPAARAWEQWTRSATYSEREIPSGSLQEWLDVTEVDAGRVVFDAHNVFQDGRDAVYTSVLYFRTADEITTDLERAGFGDIRVGGGWRNEPVGDHSTVLVFQAKIST
ncbi:MAG: class I SAM-dependent methyltransferase [Nakamurella sp.]